jgi:hypothetical protein
MRDAVAVAAAASPKPGGSTHTLLCHWLITIVFPIRLKHLTPCKTNPHLTYFKGYSHENWIYITLFGIIGKLSSFHTFALNSFQC